MLSSFEAGVDSDGEEEEEEEDHRCCRGWRSDILGVLPDIDVWDLSLGVTDRLEKAALDLSEFFASL